MPFDLSTAKPVKAKSGFDLSTAKPSRSPTPSPANAKAAQSRITALDAERTGIADRADEEMSLGGRIAGLAGELGNLHPLDAAEDYLKDYGKGMATALEDTEASSPNVLDVATGIGAPMLEYPAAMVYGAGDALLRSGDYTGSRDEAFKAMNDTLPKGARDVQGVVGAAMKPIGDTIHTAAGGIGELAAMPFDDESGAIKKNVSGVAEDVIGLVGAKKAAPEGTPALKPAKPKRAPVTQGVTADPLARARDAGYTIPGSARNAEGKTASHIGSAAEGVSGRTSGQARADQLNDQRVLVGIRKDLGLPENAAITEPAIKAIMEETEKVKTAVVKAIPALKSTPGLTQAIGGIGAKRRNNPYLKETPSVAKLRARLADASEGGSVDTVKVMDAIQEMRDDARLLSQNAEKPEVKQRAQASREAADVLENALDEALTAQGRPDVIPSLKNMRVKRAKAIQAQEAVSGKKRPGVALMDMDLAGEKLTGEMKLAADVHRDLSPNGSLSVNKAAGGGNTPGLIAETLHGVTRPLIQPVLNSERGQRFMFGERQPESLSPYAPEQFDVPPPEARQAPLLGPGVDLEPGPGNAGGPMPSDTRRLNSTIDGQAEALGPLLDLEDQPGLPGQMPSDARRLASTTEHQNQVRLEPFDLEQSPGEVGVRGPAALTEREMLDLELSPGIAELESQYQPPMFERRSSEAPYTGIDRRVNGVPDLSAERQRVLDRPIGTPANRGIADQLLADPEMQAGARADTAAGREALNPGDSLPQGGIEPGPGGGGGIGEMIDAEQAAAAPDVLAGDVLPARKPGTGDKIGGSVDQTLTLEEMDALDAAGAPEGKTALERGRERGLTVVKNKSAAELARDMTELQKSRPRSIEKMYGSNGPTPEQAAAHKKALSEWNSKYRKLQKAHKAQLEIDNKNFRNRPPSEE